MGSQRAAGTYVILNAVPVEFSTDRQSVVSCPTANGSHTMGGEIGTLHTSDKHMAIL